METGHPLAGLTGGIACGKSTVAAYLRKKGCPVIDADKVGHLVLKPGQPAYNQILEIFGERILNEKSGRRLLSQCQQAPDLLARWSKT